MLGLRALPAFLNPVEVVEGKAGIRMYEIKSNINIIFSIIICIFALYFIGYEQILYLS